MDSLLLLRLLDVTWTAATATTNLWPAGRSRAGILTLSAYRNNFQKLQAKLIENPKKGIRPSARKMKLALNVDFHYLSYKRMK